MKTENSTRAFLRAKPLARIKILGSASENQIMNDEFLRLARNTFIEALFTG